MRIAVLSILLGMFVASASAQGPDVMRIAAVVNDDVISVYDLLARLRLVIIMSKLRDTPEARQRLAPQVLRSLIDEKLHLQEAKRLSLKVTGKEVAAAVGRLEKQNNIPAGALKESLGKMGIDSTSLLDQIRSAIAWNKVVKRRVRPRVRVTEEEVQDMLDRIRTNRDQPRILVSEIFLGVDSPDHEAEVHQTVDRLIEQIRGGGNFAALARQFSERATAAVGGDLGWVQREQLAPELNKALETMQPGQISGSIRSPTGFHILALRERRLPRGAGQAVISIARIELRLPPDATADDAANQKSLAETVSQTASGCDDLKKVSQELGVEAPQMIEDVKTSDLSPGVRKVTAELDVGKASAPVEENGGLSIFMVCKRDADADLPSREDVRQTIGRQRLDILIRRYLRDLRRAAFTDIRV